MGTPEIVWMIILTLGNVIFLALKMINKMLGKNNKPPVPAGYIYNPSVPGKATLCLANRDIIIENRTDLKNLKKDVSDIFKKLDK